MDEEALNMSLRKFLKKVGVTSQREIEQAVHHAVETGKIKGDEAFQAKVVLTVEGLIDSFTIDGDIKLS